MLKADIDKDLKTAMLSGDKSLVEGLRGLKSAILYKEVADGKKEEGLDDTAIVAVLKKEQKSRRDSIAIYEQAGETLRAETEQYQIDVISKYLPVEMSEEEIIKVAENVMLELGLNDPKPQDMGRLIGAIKQAAPNADGSIIAGVVKKIINV